MIYSIGGTQAEGKPILYPAHCAKIVSALNKIKGIDEITLTVQGMEGSVDMRSILGLMSLAPKGREIKILMLTTDALSASEVATIVAQLKIIEFPIITKII